MTKTLISVAQDEYKQKLKHCKQQLKKHYSQTEKHKRKKCQQQID
jgi:hypothetical protein